MTYKQLEERYGKLTREDWHQHLLGGGWVNKAANVAANVSIHESVVIWGGTIMGGTVWGGTIMGGAIWGGTIRGGTIWGGTIRGGVIEGGTIRGGAILGGTIWGGTIRGGIIEGGTIRGGTIRGGTIRGGIIEGGTWKVTPLFVSDSRGHGASNAKPGWLFIGCEHHEFKDWKTRFPAIARKHNLNPEEIIEYCAIVDLFCLIGK